jgi:PAS domain S-box-containing protein
VKQDTGTMLFKKWRPWLWGSLAAVFGAELWFGYRYGRRALHNAIEWFDATPSLFEEALVLGLLTGLLALFITWALRRHYRRAVDELAERLEGQGENPSTQALHSLPEDAPSWVDLQPLIRKVAHLVYCYRNALAERVARASARPSATGSEGDRSFSANPSLPGAAAYANTAERMIARLAPNLTWMAVTPALQRFLGRGLADLVARPLLDVVHANDRPSLTSALREALKDGEGHNITFRVRTAADEERHLQADVLARYTEDGVPLHLRCHFFDITERVATEQELLRRTAELSQANERLRQINANLERLKESYGDLYHQAPVLYFGVDERGVLVVCNETLLQTLGYSREELIGKPYTMLLSAASRQRHLRDPAVYQRPEAVEAQWVKRDGTLLDVWIRTTPIVDEQNRFVRSRSAAQDVTERIRLASAVHAKAEELEQANAQLRRTNQELEEFTYVVSHDLKEPLRTLQAFSNFLAEDHGDRLGPEGTEQINYLIEASRRLGLLIDDLLILSRAGKVINDPRAFDLVSAIRTVQGDLADLIQRKEAVVRIEGTLPAVAGDPERVMQLLANLIGNGLKYNQSPHPEVVIGQAMGMSDMPGQVTLFVRDNGIGIEARFHEQVFRIFRRLHHREEYEGTGAGLAICKKIVEAHGGRIWVESEPGRGATFFFTLPAQHPAAELAEELEEGDAENSPSLAEKR